MKHLWLRRFVPVLIVVACCGAYRVMSAVTPVATTVPVVRATPHAILPRYDVPAVASDAQLAAVLERVQPPVGPPNTNDLLHALRLWGPGAKFADPAIPSGATMRDYLLDDEVFSRLADDAPPLIDTTQQFQRPRSYRRDDPDRRTASVHTDDVLATFGEIGLPSDTVVHGREGDTTIARLVDSALMRYHRQQYEYEWTVITYARYVFPYPEWRNRQDETIDVDGLVDEVIAQPLRLGVCGGTHRLEALVVLLRADDAEGALEPKTRAKIVAHLAHVSRLLVGSQHTEGSWAKNWHEGADAVTDDAAAGKPVPLAERILATGHHLEWLALAPPEVLPPRETLVRASQWLVRAMLEVDETTLRRDYGPFTHAARALCLWRSCDPYDAWRSGQGTIAVDDDTVVDSTHTDELSISLENRGPRS